eukprot:scaffold201486_cov15-Tisochrysis_lutea.AAC.1
MAQMRIQNVTHARQVHFLPWSPCGCSNGRVRMHAAWKTAAMAKPQVARPGTGPQVANILVIGAGKARHCFITGTHWLGVPPLLLHRHRHNLAMNKAVLEQSVHDSCSMSHG